MTLEGDNKIISADNFQEISLRIKAEGHSVTSALCNNLANANYTDLLSKYAITSIESGDAKCLGKIAGKIKF